MGTAMAEFKTKMEKVESKYKGDMKKSDEQHQKILAQTETSYKASLDAE